MAQQRCKSADEQIIEKPRQSSFVSIDRDVLDFYWVSVNQCGRAASSTGSAKHNGKSTRLIERNLVFSSSFSSSIISFSSSCLPSLDFYLDFIPRGRLNDISRKRILGIARTWISPRILRCLLEKRMLPSANEAFASLSGNFLERVRQRGLLLSPGSIVKYFISTVLSSRCIGSKEKDLSVSAASYRREFRDLESRKIVQVWVLFKSGWDCSTLRRNFWSRARLGCWLY